MSIRGQVLTHYVVLSCALVAGVLAVYLPGLEGPFLLDDAFSIVANPSLYVSELSWSALLIAAGSGESGPSGRPLAYLSFAINAWLAGGMEPAAFKATNVVIHALNAMLVFRLFLILLRMSGVQNGLVAAALGASIWALHPLQLTSVLYAVQRMTSLSALFVLLGLWLFLVARGRLERQPTLGFAGMCAGLAAGVVLGVGAKENAALMLLYVAVIEVTLLKRDDLSPRTRAALIVFYGVVTVLPIAGVLGLLIIDPALVLGSYQGHDYGAWERLLTQARVLFYYLQLVVLPRTSELALMHDDFALSRGWFEPVNTVVAVGAWVVIVMAVLRIPRSTLVPFAALWFLAGHAMESSIIGLELAFEHRNYLPLFGVCLCAGVAIGRAPKRLCCTVAVLVLGMFAAITALRAHVWSSEGALTAAWVRHHPSSPGAVGLRAQYLINRGTDPNETDPLLARLLLLDEDNITGLIELLKSRAASLPDGGKAALARVAQNPWQRLEIPSETFDMDHPLAADQRFEYLVRELERRLATRPLNASTIRGLYEFGECVRRGEFRCAVFGPHVERWMRYMGEHRGLSSNAAALTAAGLARLIWATRPQQAMEFMTRAIAAKPRNAGYRSQLASMAIATQDWDKAVEAVGWLCRAGPAHAISAEALRRQLDKAGQVVQECR